MKKLEVTFYKEVFHGMDVVPSIEKVVFDYPIDDSLTYIDNINAVYDRAVELGLDPQKNIKFKEV